MAEKKNLRFFFSAISQPSGQKDLSLPWLGLTGYLYYVILFLTKL
jgi:hypothetical protein